MIRGQVRKLFRPTQAPSASPLPFLGCTLILVVQDGCQSSRHHTRNPDRFSKEMGRRVYALSFRRLSRGITQDFCLQLTGQNSFA